MSFAFTATSTTVWANAATALLQQLGLPPAAVSKLDPSGPLTRGEAGGITLMVATGGRLAMVTGSSASLPPA